MSQDLKPIETVYKGYKFRSRLEARWAVFFDALNIPWEYEKEGYNLDGIWYLPDFWLPEQDCWIEIKGKEPTELEHRAASKLSKATGQSVYMFCGDIPLPQVFPNGWSAYPDTNISYFYFGEDGSDSGHWWCECPKCHLLGIEFSGYAERLPCDCLDRRQITYDSPRLIAAYTAARQARFESR